MAVLGIPLADERLLDLVLHALNGRDLRILLRIDVARHNARQTKRLFVPLAAASSLKGTQNGVCDLLLIKGNQAAIPLPDVLRHDDIPHPIAFFSLRKKRLHHNILCGK